MPAVYCSTLSEKHLGAADFWSRYQASQSLADLPRLTKVGQLSSPDSGSWPEPLRGLPLPALVPIIGSRGLLLSASGSGLESANRGRQGILLRLIASLPPGKLRLTMIAPPA